MNKEIQSYKKLLALITFIYLITLGGVILHYQIDSTPLYLTDLKKAYTSDEIRNLIKAMPEYQGDSLLINADKQLVSFDGLIQSFIVQVYVVPANIKYIKDAVKTTGLPEPYHVYKTAVGWYLQQHGNKTKNQIDSISVK